MKAVAIVGAGGVARGGDGDALVRRDRRARELADEPAVGELVIEHDRVALPVVCANAAKAGPDRRRIPAGPSTEAPVGLSKTW